MAFGLSGSASPGVKASGPEFVPGEVNVVRKGGEDAETYVPPPGVFGSLAGAPGGVAAQAVTAVITVEYEGFSPEAQAAFQFAVDIWKVLIVAPVEIKIHAVWEPLDADTLGSAKAAFFFRNFAGAPKREVFYALALANQLAGKDLDTSSPEIEASFNSKEPSWYLGTDGRTPKGKTDFLSVVLHEIAHGLGMTKSLKVADGSGSWGLSANAGMSYEQFVVNASNQLLISAFTNPSTSLADQLQGNNLFFNGPSAVAGARGTRPKLFAPNPWIQGSSISHLDETTYPAGNPDSLMTPYLGTAEAIHDPGPIVMGVLKDLGWTLFSTAGLPYRRVVPALAREEPGSGVPVPSSADFSFTGSWFCRSSATCDSGNEKLYVAEIARVAFTLNRVPPAGQLRGEAYWNSVKYDDFSWQAPYGTGRFYLSDPALGYPNSSGRIELRVYVGGSYIGALTANVFAPYSFAGSWFCTSSPTCDAGNETLHAGKVARVAFTLDRVPQAAVRGEVYWNGAKYNDFTWAEPYGSGRFYLVDPALGYPTGTGTIELRIWVGSYFVGSISVSVQP
jgi:hypothetical protein